MEIRGRTESSASNSPKITQNGMIRGNDNTEKAPKQKKKKEKKSSIFPRSRRKKKL
jgi:hypothetical protein